MTERETIILKMAKELEVAFKALEIATEAAELKRREAIEADNAVKRAEKRLDDARKDYVEMALGKKGVMVRGREFI